jgi:hypothetical protein
MISKVLKMSGSIRMFLREDLLAGNPMRIDLREVQPIDHVEGLVPGRQLFQVLKK